MDPRRHSHLNKVDMKTEKINAERIYRPKGPALKAYGQLVTLGFGVTTFTPASYQPHSLRGTLLPFGMGYLILRWASRLDAFSVYPVRI